MTQASLLKSSVKSFRLTAARRHDPIGRPANATALLKLLVFGSLSRSNAGTAGRALSFSSSQADYEPSSSRWIGPAVAVDVAGHCALRSGRRCVDVSQ